MQVTREQPDPCTIILNIEVDEPQVSRTFDSVYREFSNYVNVPGFRPGKAPRNLVQRFVNMERVRERAMEKLISETVAKAIETEEIQPYRNPDVEPTDLADKQAYKYKAIIPLEPQVKVGEYKGLTVERPVYKVTEEMINEQYKQLIESKAKLERVTDRPVQEGDMLIAEQKAVVEGAEGEEPPMRRQIIYLGRNIPGFDDAIMGMNIGEERTFSLTYPDDYEEEDKQGKNVTFTVKLSSISGKKLPELNEEFYKSFGDFDSEEGMKTAIRESLERQYNNQSDQVAEQRLIEQIVANSDVHFPDVLVRDEMKDEFNRMGRQLQRQGVSYEDFLVANDMTSEQYQATVRENSATRIRAILALRELSIAEGLQATEEEIDGQFADLLNNGGITEDQYEEFAADPRRRLQLANAVVQQRLHDFLFTNNTINDVEQDAPPELDEAEDDEDDVE